MTHESTLKNAPLTSRISYAQNQEDILLDRLFRDWGKGTFVDVGANHPVLDNNTYFFYLRGWRGYNLEPVRHLHALFLEQRPEDTNLAVAASDGEGTLPFYEIMNCEGLSTLSAELAEYHRKRGLEVIEHQVPVRTLAQLIAEHRIQPPDLLTIDVEGLEEKVIGGIPLDVWRPKVVVVESTEPETNISTHTTWEPALLRNGYLFATFNGVNRFYLREDLRDHLPRLHVPVNVLDCYRRREALDLENQIFDLKNQVDQVHAGWERDVARYELMRSSWDWAKEQAQHERNSLQDLYFRLNELFLDAHSQLMRRDEQLQAAVNDVSRNAASEAEKIRTLTEQNRVLATQNKALRREAHWQLEASWQLEALTRQNEELQDAADQQLQALARQHQELQGDLTEIREAFAEQLQQLTARFHVLTNREQELRRMLLEAHEQLLRRDEVLQGAFAAEAASENGGVAGHGPGRPLITGPVAAASPHPAAGRAGGAGAEPAPHETGGAAPAAEWEPYTRLLRQVRETVQAELPADAVVVVFSEGDEEFLRLGGRRGWHFPQAGDGGFSAEYPADGAAAVEHLEELRTRGATHVLVPAPALWVLDRYGELRDHLEGRYPVVDRRESCTIYALGDNRGNGKQRTPTAGGGRTRPRPFGVNIAGNIASEKGTGEAVRATIRSVAAAGIPYALTNVVDDFSDNPDQTYADFAADNPYAFNVIQANADMVPPFVDQKGPEYLRGRYNVGYWFWELAEFPRREWENSFQYLDEVWVGSNFVLDAVSRVSPVPVVKIPVSLPEHLPIKACDRAYFGIPADRVVFLFIVDFMSIPERKNPHGLIRAFKKAFGPSDQALLVIKGAHSSPEWLKAVGAPPNVLQAITEAGADANVRIIDRVMARDEINALLALSDCYVSLHRSEGFGLPLAEAMSLGRPVIATSYSGNMEFMTPGNSFLVKYDLVELREDYGPYRKGCVWADPDLDHAAELMRYVYDNRDRAAAVGRRAREDVLRTLHPRVVGALVKDRLQKIAEQGVVPVLPPADAAGERPGP
jgi:FkbM family methyltransferase